MKRAAFLLGALLGLGLALAGCNAEHSPGRTPRPPTDLRAEVPKPATFTDCPLAVIDGVEIALGQDCMYVEGKLVGVRIKAGGGWIMAD